MDNKHSENVYENANSTEKLLFQSKKQLSISRAILGLLLIVIVLLLLILFKKYNCSCNCQGVIGSEASGEISGNKITISLQEGGKHTDDPGTHGGEDQPGGPDNPDQPGGPYNPDQPHGPDTPEGDGPAEPAEQAEIKLSNKDEYIDNRPFDEVFLPGDSVTKKYAVEVEHKNNTNLRLSITDVLVYGASGNILNLNNVLQTDNSVLDIINLNIKVSGTEKYSGTLKNFIKNGITVSHALNTGSATDIVKYDITASIPSEVSDDFSNNDDGNYQNMQVNFSFKWWTE